MKDDKLKLMAVLAHPDDESLGMGGVLARYVAEGVEVSLVCATRGERGWFGKPEAYPGMEALGHIREGELMQAAEHLGLHEVVFLDYVDGDLDQANPRAAAHKIAVEIRRLRPQVVVTFDPFGAYGHPDHIAISQLTGAAIVHAASSSFVRLEHPPHQVSKLYYLTETQEHVALYRQVFGELKMTIDDVERMSFPWAEWAITTEIDTQAYSAQVWDAIMAHRTQLPGYEDLITLRHDPNFKLWDSYKFYRVFSLVNGGREPEDDLFAGARDDLIIRNGHFAPYERMVC